MASRMTKTSIQGAALVLLGLLAGAWASAQQPAAGVAPTAASPVPAASPLTEEDVNRYRIGPSDVIQVFVWRSPELTTTVPVRPDGKISTPLVEDMVANGKTPTELARDIEKVLAEYIRSPQVSVIVTQPASLFSQVRVVGQVRQPTPLPYRQGMTVLDALLAVGGLGDFAAGNRAKIVRTTDGKNQEIRIKADDLLNKGDMSQNRELQPGDVLVIPESRW
jgi:polysaccharide export outer membrane protein